MITVKEIRDTFATLDPATGQWQEMTNVVFIEKGRSGVNRSLSASSEFLDELVGEKTGLDNTRTHTQPVRAELVEKGKFPVDSEHRGHINREMWSTPQMANQQDKVPRIIDQKVTYFKTKLEAIPKEDEDYRTVSITSDSVIPQELLNQATQNMRATQVRTIHRAPAPVVETQPRAESNAPHTSE